MILNEGILNTSYMFDNCQKLLEFSIYDDIINTDNEFIEKSTYDDYDKDYSEYSDDDSFSESEITLRSERNENQDTNNI